MTGLAIVGACDGAVICMISECAMYSLVLRAGLRENATGLILLTK